VALEDAIRGVLSDPSNLPASLLDYLIQHQEANRPSIYSTRSPVLLSTGTPGATAASRYVGATTSGAPAAGNFQVGDFVIAQDGHIFICTVAGTPGTWVDAGSYGAGGGGVTSFIGRTGVVVAVNGDYTTALVPDSLNKRYVTDAQLVVIGNTSGTNTGDQTSVSGNAGTATKLATSRNIDGQPFDGSADITVIAPGTHAATAKATPVDADEIPLVDSAAANVLKRLTWANLKATLKSYFDTLYQFTNTYITTIDETIPANTQVNFEDYLELSASLGYELASGAMLVIGDQATPLPLADITSELYVARNNVFIDSNRQVVIDDMYEITPNFMVELSGGSGLQPDYGAVLSLTAAHVPLAGVVTGADSSGGFIEIKVTA
jgi:hypothetical protein